MFELMPYKGKWPKCLRMIVLMHKHTRSENESER